MTDDTFQIEVVYKPRIAELMGDGRGWAFSVTDKYGQILPGRNGLVSEAEARAEAENVIEKWKADTYHNVMTASVKTLRAEVNLRKAGGAQKRRAAILKAFNHFAPLVESDAGLSRKSANRVFEQLAYALIGDGQSRYKDAESLAVAEQLRAELKANGFQGEFNQKNLARPFDRQCLTIYRDAVATSRPSIGT